MIAETADRSIRFQTATPDLKAAINRLVARQMAAEIIAAGVDPDDDAGVRATLLAAGFTDRTIGPLAYSAAVYAAVLTAS